MPLRVRAVQVSCGCLRVTPALRSVLCQAFFKPFLKREKRWSFSLAAAGCFCALLAIHTPPAGTGAKAGAGQNSSAREFLLRCLGLLL